MELVVNWDSVCLVCLQQGDMKSIYEKDEKEVTLSEKIMLCSSIELDNGETLPEQICSGCYEDLEVAYRFRTNCESTNIILKSLLKQSNVNDLEMTSSSGEVYNFKLPVGLELKRVKIKRNSGSSAVKNEVAELKQDPDELVDADSHSYEDEFVVHELEDEEDQPLANYQRKSTDPEEEDSIEKQLVEMLEADQAEETYHINTKTTKIEKPKKSTAKASKQGRSRLAKIPQILQDPVDLENITTVTYVQNIREDGKPMKICDICGNTYKYQHALDSHMRRHRNEKPFACEFCDRAFVANVELRRHMRVHTGQKPYACHYCERRFSDFGSRIKHERTHTGERPYACTTCGKAFAYAHVLSVHLLTHTGEKKFKCEVCNKGFTKKTYLTGHMKVHKGTVVTSDKTANISEDATTGLVTEMDENQKPESDETVEEVYFDEL